MTKTTTVLETGNAGDHDYAIVQVDITSLQAVGEEPFDPSTVGFDVTYGASVLNKEDSTLIFNYDPRSGFIEVLNIADGSNVTDTADVGTVTLKLLGNFSA